MKKIKSQQGQALILIALAIVGLVGFTALTVDGGRVLSDRRNAQNAADTAALSAALTKIKTTGNESAKNAAAITAAETRAEDNGYDGLAASDVEVHIPPISGPYIGNAEYIQVIIKSYVPTTFARVLGRTLVENKVEAVTRVQGSSSTSNGALFNGAAMVATKGGNTPQCFLTNGGAYLTIHDSGIFVNCSSNDAIRLNGSSTLNMDADGEVVGQYYPVGNPTYDHITEGVNGGVSKVIDASTFAGVPTTVAPPTCSGNGTASGTTADRDFVNGNPPSVTIKNGKTSTLTEGNWNSIIINNGTAVFSPGTYCISGNINFNGGLMSGPVDRVELVLQNSIVLNGGTTIDMNDLEIYTTNANFTLNGGAIFRADRLRVFSTGGTIFDVGGNSELSSDDAYFYLKSGSLNWTGTTILNLHSPRPPDPFAGLLVHMPYGNATPVNFNGGTDIHLTGTFLAPSSEITFNGGVGFELHSQIIASTYIVDGGGGKTIDIYYQADENYGAPVGASPTIELVK